MIIEIPSWIINNLDWVGYAMLAYGIYHFGKFRTIGFYWASIGSLVLLAWGIYCHHWGTVCWNCIFFLLYYNAYRNGQQISNFLNQVLKKEDK